MALKEKGIAAEFLSSTKTADAKNKVNYSKNDADIVLQMKYLLISIKNRSENSTVNFYYSFLKFMSLYCCKFGFRWIQKHTV